MRIRKVILENYRCHKYLETEFTTGVNLLLGENGSGKSSVLEALGFALFDADLRNGLQSDAIQSGTSYATISVEFEATDENTYTVSRRIGNSSYYRLSGIGESHSRIEGKQEVLTKIRELTGINGNEKNIYQNVITAAQNKLVGIFLEQPKHREAVFNQIFNTEIYRKMYKNYLKTALDNYSNQKALKQNEIDTLTGTLSDKNLLLQQLQENNDIRDKTTKELKIICTKTDIIQKEKEALEKQEKALTSLQEKCSHMSEMLQQTETALTMAQESVAKAEKAATIAEENRVEHLQYETTSKQFHQTREKLTKLENIETELQKSIKKQQHLEKDSVIIEKELESIERTIEDRKTNRKEQEERITNNKQILESLDNTLKTTKNDLHKYQQIELSLQELEQEYTNTEESIKKIQTEAALLQERLDKETELQKHKESLTNKLQILKDKEKEHKEQLGNLKILEARIFELESNKEALEKGSCPFFLEKCKNLEGIKSPQTYFIEKKDLLSQEQTTTENALQKLEKELNALKEYSEEQNRISLELLQLKTVSNDLKQCIESIELKKEKMKIISEKIKIQLNNTLYIDSLEKYPITKINEEVKKDNAILKEKINQLNEQYNNTVQQHKEQKNKADTLDQEIKKLSINQNNLTTKQQNNTSELQKLSDCINTLKEKIQPLSTLKEERAAQEKEMERLQEAHDRFAANISIAKDIQKFKMRSNELDSELQEKLKQNKSLKADLHQLEKQYDPNLLKQNKTELATIETEKDRLIRLEQKHQESISRIEQQIQEHKNRLNEIQSCKSELSNITKKLQLTDLFRNKVNTMGKKVAIQFLTHIERLATNNFHNITGRTEEIRWSNEDKEAYTLYLCKDKNIKKGSPFAILSGGEQVAVALSLRAAMAAFFSASDFTIFDEPTINLDIQRRAALAENLGKLLKDLRQAIIVTHDDTFREMAQNVINFSEKI